MMWIFNTGKAKNYKGKTTKLIGRKTRWLMVWKSEMISSEEDYKVEINNKT